MINDKLDSDEETQGGFEGEKLKGKVSDKMDGLQQFQSLLSLAQTNLGAFLEALRNLRTSDNEDVYTQLKLFFKNDPAWQEDSSSEISQALFMGSSLFRVE